MDGSLFDWLEAKTAREARDAALDDLEIARGPWINQARAVALKIWKDNGGQPICVDDIRRILPPDPCVDPRVMGAVLRAPDWAACGFVNSNRVQCHGRPIRYFVRVSEFA